MKKIIFIGNGIFEDVFDILENKITGDKLIKEVEEVIIHQLNNNKHDSKLYKLKSGKEEYQNYLGNFIYINYMYDYILNDSNFDFKKLEELSIEKELSFNTMLMYLNSRKSSKNFLTWFTNCQLIDNNTIKCVRYNPPSMTVRFEKKHSIEYYNLFVLNFINYWIFLNLNEIFKSDSYKEIFFTKILNIYKSLDQYDNIFSLNYFNLLDLWLSPQENNCELNDSWKSWIRKKIIYDINNHLKKYTFIHSYKKHKNKNDTNSFINNIPLFLKFLENENIKNSQYDVFNNYDDFHLWHLGKHMVIRQEEKNDKYYNNAFKNINYNDINLEEIVFFGISYEAPLIKFLCKKLINNKNINWKIYFYNDINSKCEHNNNCKESNFKKYCDKCIKEQLWKPLIKKYEFNNIQLKKSSDFYN